MQVPIGKLIVQMTGMLVVLALLLFLPASTLAWGPGWVFLLIFYGGCLAITLWLLKANPALVNERMTGLGKPDRKAWDRPLMALISLLFVAWLVVMPLDAVRFHWSHVPLWVQAVGGVLLCVSFYMFYLTYRENSFLSPAMRIQKERGQTVIATGPYRYVRHPMYASALVLFIGGSLLLGSWAGLLVGLLLTAVLARRAVLEESMLSEELPGYTEYMTQVKYRLIPYLW